MAGSSRRFRGTYFNRRMLAVMLLGISSGIPFAAVGATLQAWLKTSNVDLAIIGLFSLARLPYNLKFLWAPLMDRYVPPFWGRRRGWILISQLGLAVMLAVLAFTRPEVSPMLTFWIALIATFFSASQDIVADAYRTDVLEKEELGPGASLYITGYRLGLLISGSLALILADHFSWQTVYLFLACTLGIGVIGGWVGPEPRDSMKAPKSLKDAVVKPFVEYFQRRGAAEILAFIILYKLDMVMATALTTPFILDLGFTKTDLGAVTKSVGLIATIVGTLAGGAWMIKLGMKRALWVFGVAQGIANLSFFALARAGHDYPMMVTAIAADNFFSGMGTAAFSAFLMSLCDKHYTATQYALLTSFMALSGTFGGAPSGFLAKSMGWPSYYIFCTLLAIPGLLLLTRFDRWNRPNSAS